MQEFLLRVRRATIRAFVAWDQETAGSVQNAARQRAWNRYRRLLDRLARGANWQIGRWRLSGEEPSFTEFDEIDQCLRAQGFPDTTQPSTEALNDYLHQTRSLSGPM